MRSSTTRHYQTIVVEMKTLRKIYCKAQQDRITKVNAGDTCAKKHSGLDNRKMKFRKGRTASTGWMR